MTDFNDDYADFGGFGGRPPRAGWQDGYGLRGLQPPSEPTIQGDLVSGHGRRYVIGKQPRPIVIYTEQPKKINAQSFTCNPDLQLDTYYIPAGSTFFFSGPGFPTDGTVTNNSELTIIRADPDTCIWNSAPVSDYTLVSGTDPGVWGGPEISFAGGNYQVTWNSISLFGGGSAIRDAPSSHPPGHYTGTGSDVTVQDAP